jgi:hypothetical protein
MLCDPGLERIQAAYMSVPEWFGGEEETDEVNNPGSI